MKIKTVIVVGIFLLTILIIIMAAVFKYDSFKKEKIRIALVIKTINPNNDFWQIVLAGAEIAAKELNVELEINGPALEKNIEEQIDIIEEIIKTKPYAIILAACDVDALVPVAEKIVEQKIVLVTVDSGINSSIPSSFIATDNFKGGEILGAEMEELLSPGDSVIIISHVQGTLTAIERERGVRSIIEKNGKLDIVGTYFCDNLEENAYDITLDVINSNMEIKGIIALNAISTVGTAQAIDNSDLKDEIFLVGFDNSFEELQFLEQGVIKALIVQKPFNMGYISVKTVVDILNGKSVISRIDTGLVLINLLNINSPENQKLIFPLPIITELAE